MTKQMIGGTTVIEDLISCVTILREVAVKGDDRLRLLQVEKALSDIIDKLRKDKAPKLEDPKDNS